MKGETVREMCERLGEKPDTIRMRWNALRSAGNPLFAASFSRDSFVSPAQVDALIQAGSRKKREFNKVSDIAAPVANEQPAAAFNPPPAPVETVKNTGNSWPLWVALAGCLCASFPNMLQVTGAMKEGGNLSAWALTCSFIAAPALLIWGRVNGILRFVVVALVVGFTAFCNAVAVFGSLTSLDSGFVLLPSRFLETVTNFFNTPYASTARALGFFMAVLVAAIEVTAVYSISKK